MTGENALPPTTSELRDLVEKAMAGSREAKSELEKILREHGELRGRVEKLEAALKEKETPPPPPSKPAPAPARAEDLVDDVGDDFDLLGG